MVGYYKRRNPLFNKKGLVYKRLTDDRGTKFWYEAEASKICWCKDDGFKTIYTSSNGHTESVTTGTLTTIDLYEGDILPEDHIVICGSTYIVTSVEFIDNDMENCLSKRPSGTTKIEVRK